MMGQQAPEQNALFYNFCIEQHVPPHHLLRQIDQVLELDFLRDYLASFYSHTGRPSIDPELMLRMLIVGYCYGIRSERRLCEEVHLNLAYRWFCRLGLEGAIPNHSTFSKNRHGRFRDSGLFRKLFEEVVSQCIDSGYVGGEGFATDASVIRASANRQNGVARKEALEHLKSHAISRPIREYLDALEQENSMGAMPKNVSVVDPYASWTSGTGEKAFYAYSTNYLIDIEQNIIMDVEPSTANRIAEVHSTRMMIDRVEESFDIKPNLLIGDTAYGAAPMLDWLVQEKDIAPHVPVWQKGQNKALFGRDDFSWDAQADKYVCPAGKDLLSRKRNFTKKPSLVTKSNTINYRASQLDCRTCHLKEQCCPNALFKRIQRSVYEESRDVAREIAKTKEYQQSRKDRKKVEVLFAHLKAIMKLERLRLRGPSGARDEFVMAATVQNLRRLAKLKYKPPGDGIVAPA